MGDDVCSHLKGTTLYRLRDWSVPDTPPFVWTHSLAAATTAHQKGWEVAEYSLVQASTWPSKLKELTALTEELGGYDKERK